MKAILSISLTSLLILLSSCSLSRKEVMPIPSDKPSVAQLQQIKRKYGMFMHFGINTFHDTEWTDGTKPASSYKPKTIDADQWIRTAKEAGMKYVILISKHHDGFCLWDSQYTDYDVANSGNKTNVILAVAKACKKYNIGLGLYYSLWDRHQNADTQNSSLDSAYNAYVIKQINELIDITKPYTDIVEFWLDGAWEKANNRWNIKGIYQTIKAKEPNCQVGVNWSIGSPKCSDQHYVRPKDQQAGYPIRYFPSDFRLGDPFLPRKDDPKIFSYEGKSYYMPWESTVCISRCWFYNTKDKNFKSIDELEKLYKQATANDNILILNCPPNTEGRLRNEDVAILMALKKRLNLK